MIDLRVDVGVEPVLLRSRDIPGGGGLSRTEADLHDRLDALEAVLPGHDEAQRRAVLVGQDPAVEPDQDRKSTRLNSSHSQISYAVFCLKKKKLAIDYTTRMQ